MTTWSGIVFIVIDEAGQKHVGLTMPEGMVVPAERVTTLQGTGPRPPAPMKPVAVSDLAAWMAERQSEGFTFNPVT